MPQTSGFGVPVLFNADLTVCELLRPVSLTGENNFKEVWLQRVLYTHPETLPIGEIDAAFLPLIPLCMEMTTPAGPIDVVYVTPTGRLALLETKLWRNPDARREVIGQILDYAKELTSWDYSRLDVAVGRARKNEGKSDFPGIAGLVATTQQGLVLHQFQDAVSRSLAKGDYLLLIAGDGIREGVGAIAQYLDKYGALHFTFGLIECAVYNAPNGGRYVHPRVLTKTTNILRTVFVSGVNPVTVVGAGSEESEESEDRVADETRSDRAVDRQKYEAFWSEVLKMMKVEAAQMVRKPSARDCQRFHMQDTSDAWVTAYLEPSLCQVGVFLRFKRTPNGDRLFKALRANEVEVSEALGVEVEWETNERGNSVTIKTAFPEGFLTTSREAVQKWLANESERFISVFRPKIDQLLRDQV